MSAPASGRTRLESLDVTRGIAILLIFTLNVPLMGQTLYQFGGDPRLLGWTSADRAAWWFQTVALAGTQRGLLQFLFGAGAVILLGRTLDPAGPVGDADRYFRRVLWLMGFGLLDIFAICWVGDILLVYSIAALFLFPFRRLGPRALIALAVLGLLVPTVRGLAEYRAGRADRAAATLAGREQARGRPLDASARRALAAWEAREAHRVPSPAPLAEERAAHSGSIAATWSWYSTFFLRTIVPGYYPIIILEAFGTMLLGMALFKLGILQGDRSPRFYLMLAGLAYLPGLALRAVAAGQEVDFRAGVTIGLVAGPAARIAVTLGHVGLINLLLLSPAGRRLLGPTRAVGRTAFSLYLMQNFLGVWVLFSRVGLDLWGRFGWAEFALIAAAVMAGQVVLANLWLRAFAIGPLEWAWRSLVALEVLPWLHPAAAPRDLVPTAPTLDGKS